MIAFIDPNNTAEKNAQLFLNLHRAFKSAAKAERKAERAAERAQKANDKAIEQAKFFLESKVNEAEAEASTETKNPEPTLPFKRSREFEKRQPLRA